MLDHFLCYWLGNVNCSAFASIIRNQWAGWLILWKLPNRKRQDLVFSLVELWHPSTSNQFPTNVSIVLHVYPVVFDMFFDVTWCGLMLDSLQTKYTKGFQTARAHGWSFWRHFSSSQSPQSYQDLLAGSLPRSAGSAWKGLEEKPEFRGAWLSEQALCTAHTLKIRMAPQTAAQNRCCESSSAHGRRLMHEAWVSRS